MHSQTITMLPFVQKIEKHCFGSFHTVGARIARPRNFRFHQSAKLWNKRFCIFPKVMNPLLLTNMLLCRIIYI